MSMSLLGVSSPREKEPNSHAFKTGCVVKYSAIFIIICCLFIQQHLPYSICKYTDYFNTTDTNHNFFHRMIAKWRFSHRELEASPSPPKEGRRSPLRLLLTFPSVTNCSNSAIALWGSDSRQIKNRNNVITTYRYIEKRL